MKYIIGSGWWCDNSDFNTEGRVLYGDSKIRSMQFHELWLNSIKENSNPEKIIIVDSNSPIKPEIEIDERIEFISLNENGRHAVSHLGKYSGWTRSVILSLQYASLCDCDYYVYVEQDVLLKGDGIIEHCISKMDKPYMFGRCNNFGNPLQQSFFIIRKDAFESFLIRLMSIKESDSMIMPERKFALATSKFKLPSLLFIRARSNWILRASYRLQTMVLKIFRNYDYLPIGYGRDRPIKFNDKYYYFQHGTINEIEEHFRNESN